MQGIQDAYVTICLVDGKGNVIGRPQDTPTTNNLAGNHVLFNCEVSCLSPSHASMGSVIHASSASAVPACNASTACMVGHDWYLAPSEMPVAVRCEWLFCSRYMFNKTLQAFPAHQLCSSNLSAGSPTRRLLPARHTSSLTGTSSTACNLESVRLRSISRQQTFHGRQSLVCCQ